MRYSIAFALITTGCVAVSQPSSFPISYIAEDSPKEARIYLKYRNDGKMNSCLYSTNWPGNDGRIDSGKGRVFITVDGKYYSTADFDSGYCPSCALKVEPGHEVTGFFNYKDFDLPTADYMKEKSLKFSPMASSCSSQN